MHPLGIAAHTRAIPAVRRLELIAARALRAGVVGYQRLQGRCRTADTHNNGEEGYAAEKRSTSRTLHGLFNFHNTTSSQNKHYVIIHIILHDNHFQFHD